MEKTFNIPLRKEFRKVPRYKRARKAMTALHEFLVRHMKSDDVRIGAGINKAVWANGIKNPPHHVPVHAEKDDKGVVRAELVGVEIQKQKAEDKKGLREKLGLKKKEPKGEEKKEAEEKPTSETPAPVETKPESEAAPAEEKPKPKPKKNPKKPAVKEKQQ
jgi:large subunit ribosomal protein L31e